MGTSVQAINTHPKMPSSRRPRSKSPLDKARAHEVEWARVSDVFAACASLQDVSYVYFIGEADDGAVKIGVAKDPVARLRGMQTGNPRRLCVERVIVGDRAVEGLLHRFWERFAIVTPTNLKKPEAFPGTEWFKSEIRGELYPIIETAAGSQVAFLEDAAGDIRSEDMERLVREAHITHEFVFRQPDEIRLLGEGAGYVSRRAARVES